VGDSTTIDLTGITLTFDRTSGDYTIRLTTTNVNPFKGTFRANVNLFNPAAGQAQASFQDNVNDYDLTAPTTSIELSGNDSKLTAWAEGHQVVADTNAGLGNPPNSRGFQSGILLLPTISFEGDSTSGAIASIRRSN
jgi:hypothetical protein